MEEYERDLKIDRDNLDVEWVNQARLYVKWSNSWAQAVYEKDKAKEKLDLVRAELDYDIRTDPGKYSIEGKLTESAISASIIQQKKYLEANAVLIDANKNMNILGGAKEAMNHKRSALENVTKLWLGNYYAEPNIDADVVKKVEEVGRQDQLKGLKDNLRLRRRRKNVGGS